MATDYELLDAWRAGDRDAGNELFERHFESVCRFFRNKIGDGVEDLIQTTFLACVKGKDQFRGESSFRTYLFTIARHELYRHFKRRAKEAERFAPDEISVMDMQASPSKVAAGRAEQRLLLDALRKLPLNHQIALELYYWEDMSAAELGRVLEIPEGTVRTRLRKAKQLLEASLRESMASAAAIESTLTGLEEWARSLKSVVREPDDS